MGGECSYQDTDAWQADEMNHLQVATSTAAAVCGPNMAVNQSWNASCEHGTHAADVCFVVCSFKINVNLWKHFFQVRFKPELKFLVKIWRVYLEGLVIGLDDKI